MRKRTALLSLVFATMMCAPAWAQVDFSTLKLEPGDRARVLQRSGIEVGGLVTDVAPDRLTIGGFTFAPDAVLKIDRGGDSILTGGTLVGMAVGAFVGSVIPICDEGRASCVLGGMISYGGVGALIDVFHRGQTTVFRGQPRTAPGVVMAPVISRHGKAVVVSLGF